ncbi:hypothetical protein ACFU5O_03570 [Streptomyces sp. NPDC057445]|uniref:hypothetical protein n=1 Tax=Streptomyces sp. NPDC057445 TaxID=3346136 RepID=UPI0036B80DCB
MNPVFTELDPYHGDHIDAVFSLRTEAAREDTPWLPAPCRADLAGSVRVPPPATRVEEWLVTEDGGAGAAVASLRLEFPTEENIASVTAAVLVVRPGLRRRGVGRAVMEFAGARGKLDGRSRLLLCADAAAGAGEAVPGAAFVEALGARAVMTLDHLRLNVADAPATAPLPDGYASRTWGSTVPEDLVAEAVRLEATLSADAPTGDLDWEPQPAAISRIRDFERMRIARGRRAHQTGVSHQGTGRLVAWSAVSMTTANPDNALQAVTVVDPDHRGHGLGRLVKALNLGHVRASEPQLRTIDTWNSSGNVHMRRINEEFGFRPAGSRRMWELDI